MLWGLRGRKVGLDVKSEVELFGTSASWLLAFWAPAVWPTPLPLDEELTWTRSPTRVAGGGGKREHRVFHDPNEEGETMDLYAEMVRWTRREAARKIAEETA